MNLDDAKVGAFVQEISAQFQKLNYAERLEACAGMIVLACADHNVRGPQAAKQACFVAARIIDLDLQLFTHQVSVDAAWLEKAAREAKGEKSS